jgi:hypothetical protein
VRPSSLYLAIALSLACATRHGPASDPFPVWPAIAGNQAPYQLLAIRFARLECLGTCPAYAVELNRHGGALYQGQRFAPHIGVYTSFVDSAAFAAIEERVIGDGFFDLLALYPSALSDGPATSVTALTSQGSFTVLCEDACPPQYDAIVALIDSTIVQLHWQKKHR